MRSVVEVSAHTGDGHPQRPQALIALNAEIVGSKLIRVGWRHGGSYVVNLGCYNEASTIRSMLALTMPPFG